MKLKKTTLEEGAIAELYEEADFKHPYLTIARFVFADDKPNGNNQGIEYEDFAEVKATAIDMPVKMKFLGEAGVGNHAGSVTVGHIRKMDEEEVEDGSHRLVAEAVLYAGEYPEEVEFLKKKFEEGTAPGVSWEVTYKDVKKEGPISWLKGIITTAATFVRSPAYGMRTALLALASSTELTDEEINDELQKIVDENRPKITVEGGSNKVEEELKKLQAELEEAMEKIKTLEATNETLTTAKAELEEQVKERDEEISKFTKAELVASRTAKVAEAGLKIEDDEVLAKKQEYWASLSEEQFAEYLDDLKAVKPATSPEPRKGLASLRTDPLPRVEPGADSNVTTQGLLDKFRTLSRGSVETQ